MLLVLLIVAIGLATFGIVYGIKERDFELEAVYGTLAPAIIIGVIIIIPFIFGLYKISQERVIDQKIEMYIEENASIELNVTTTVEKYLEHEFQIFDSLKGEDIQTLLVVYPEINSNELVKKQIEIFVENNNKIKELREDKLDIEVWKWWVYFG